LTLLTLPGGPLSRIDRRQRLVALAALLAAVFQATAALAAETVTFPGDGVTLRAILFRPPGPGPYPSVIALHGCAGLFGKDGGLSPRHVDWAGRLNAKGFAVMFPDSFGSRGAEAQCKTADRVTRPSRERAADALAAKAYLQLRADIRPDAISLLGWSNGGSTVLYAVQKTRAPKDGKPDFAKAIAVYPGCRTPAENGKWHARLPLLILIGAADDWTPAAPCEDLAANAKAAGEPVSIILYPGAYHDFDHPDLKIHTTRGLAYTATGSRVAHSGTDPAAREDALARVPAFLQR
jgi:dienelactone hydrolase